jgi:putative Mn2+ efflux pump MntP
MEYYFLLFVFLILALLGVIYMMSSFMNLNEETETGSQKPGLVSSINKGIGIEKENLS